MKKVISFLFFILTISSAVSAAEITCKRDMWSDVQKLMFYENDKNIATHTTECGGAEKKEGTTINARVRFIDKINGPVYDKTYSYLIYKNNTITDGKHKEYYLEGKKAGEYAGYWSSKNGKAEGLSEYYYKTGKILQTAKFKKGKAIGKIKRYYETGVLYSEETYSADNTAGELKTYYASGKQKEILRVKACKRAGAEYFDKEGKKLNFTARAAAAGAIPAVIALFSLYLAALGFMKIFSGTKPEVKIVTGPDEEKAEITADKQIKKTWIFLSLFFSFLPWLALMLYMTYFVYTFAKGDDTGFGWGTVLAVAVDAFVAVLLGWYFLINLDGKEIVSSDGSVLCINRTWAGFKIRKTIKADEILKIHAVVIEKESGEQYYGTSEIQKSATSDLYETYVSVMMKSDEIITFAKFLDKQEMDKLIGFLKSKMPGIVSEEK